MKKLLLILLLASGALAQSAPLALETEAVLPRRFLAAHGQRAIIEGYSAQGLEAWVYPYQVFRDYRLALRRAGDSSAVDALQLLRRAEVTPATVTRIYAGPDYVLRETLFAPLDRKAVLLRFEVDSPVAVDVLVRFTPVMDLMWPASTGGQNVVWNAAAKGFVLTNNDGVRALITSPQMTAHDAQWNSTGDPLAGEVGFTIHVEPKQAASVVIVAQTAPGLKEEDLAREARGLLTDAAALREAAEDHYRKLLATSLRVETPDAAVNSALQWAAAALEQTWVCTDDLGCAPVAGYGPSRRARRPQYQWFFAGDGMVGAQAAVNLGWIDRARQQLEFVMTYQDADNGMMWHELTLSAKHLDWKNAFPYMYVHVDLTFQFLSSLRDYVSRSGDVDLVRRHWKQVDAAYNYCRGTLDPQTHLPRIPESKSGGNEQDKLADELTLSTAWVDASNAYAELAEAVGHAEAAQAAREASREAAKQIVPRYWNEQAKFFSSGHTHDGQATAERSLAVLSVLDAELPLTAAQRDAVLDQLTSSDFETDWGPRSVAPGAGYQPDTYAKGSVWPVAAAETASVLWRNHRPWAAEAVWRTIFLGNTFDSLGHIPEVYSGSFFREQEESVPEQTWSSAGLISGTIEGMLGLRGNALGELRLEFAPNLPATWDFVRLHDFHWGEQRVQIELQHQPQALELKLENDSAPFVLEYRPLLPLAAKVTAVKLNGHAAAFQDAAEGADPASETRTSITVRVPHGTTHVRVEFRGGVELLIPPAEASVGDTSNGWKLRSARVEDGHLRLRVDLPTARSSLLRLRSPLTLTSSGAALQHTPGTQDWLLTVPATKDARGDFRTVELDVLMK